ncbi:MAG: hypothetical protein AAFW81_08110 [Pseudomonadota bacterium]
MGRLRVFFAGAAALFLFACGENETSKSPAQSAVAAPSPLEEPFKLEGAEAVDVEALLALMPAASRPTYDAASFDEDLGATVITNLTFSDADDGEAIVVARAELYGVDVEAIERVRAADGGDPDAPFETLFQKIRLLNISAEGFDDAGKEQSLKLVIEGLEIDDMAMRQGGPGNDESGDPAARFLNATRIGGIYFKGLDWGARTGDQHDLKLAVADGRLVGLAGGAFDALIAKDIAYDFEQGDRAREAIREIAGPGGAAILDGPFADVVAPERQKANIESFEWRGFDMTKLVKYEARGEEPPTDARDLVDFGTAKITGLTTFVNDRELGRLGELSISEMKFTGLVLSDFRMTFTDSIVDYSAYFPPAEEDAVAALSSLGLNSVKGEGFIDWRWDPETGDGRLQYEGLNEGLGDVLIDVDVSGVDLDGLAAASGADADDLFARSLKLRSLSVDIADENALEAIFALAALEMGGAGEDLRQSTPALIRLSSAQFAFSNPRIVDYVDALASFVAEGGSLKIEAKPEDPVGAAFFENDDVDPTTLPEILNLNVTHTE